jgi:hypothetical protein
MSVMNHTIKIMGQWVSLSKIISPQVSSAISWQSALLVEKFKQNHRTAVRHFSYIVVIMFITGGTNQCRSGSHK